MTADRGGGDDSVTNLLGQRLEVVHAQFLRSRGACAVENRRILIIWRYRPVMVRAMRFLLWKSIGPGVRQSEAKDTTTAQTQSIQYN